MLDRASAVLSGLGRLEEALAALAETARRAADVGDTRRQAWALAECAILAPDAPDARRRAEQALDLLPGIESQEVVTLVWWAMAETAPDPRQAIEAYDRAIAHSGETEPHRYGIVVCRRGEQYLALGRLDEARRALASARSMPRHHALDRAIARLDERLPS